MAPALPAPVPGRVRVGVLGVGFLQAAKHATPIWPAISAKPIGKVKPRRTPTVY